MTTDEIYARLKELAPSVSFEATREQDNDAQWDGDTPDPTEDGYIAFDVDVRAATIVDGKLLEEFAYLGGCYMLEEEPIDNVHGYLPQMLQESATNLKARLTSKHPAHAELGKALEFLSAEMRSQYEAQRVEIEAQGSQPCKP